MKSISVITLALCLWKVSGQATAPFKCNTPNGGTSLCGGANGVCDYSTGSCTCTGTYQNYDCSYQTANVNTDSTCNGHGKSANEGSGSMCYCNEGYYGTNCEYSRLEVTQCLADKMNVNINTYGMAVKVCRAGMSATAACCYQASAAPSPRMGLQFDLMYTDATCGNVATETANNMKTYYAMVDVFYGNDYLTALDYRATFNCSQPDSNTATLTPEPVSVTSLVDQNPSDAGSTVVTVNPVTMALTKGDGSAIGTPKLGDPIKLAYTLDTTFGFDDMLVVSVTADDGAASSPSTLEMVTTPGCATMAASGVLQGYVKSTKTAVTLTFTTFKFRSTSTVRIAASVMICKAGATACGKPTCGATHVTPNAFVNKFPGAKRRRAAENTVTGAEVLRLNTTLFVISAIPNEEHHSGNKHKVHGGSAECMQSMAFVVTVAVLGVLLLMTMALTLFFCTRLTRSPRTQMNMDNVAFKS